jgi:hypothetical protein
VKQFLFVDLQAICVLLFAVVVAGECCGRQPAQWHQQQLT